MHYYIFDQNTLAVDKFEKLQTEALGLLAEFKVSGEVARVTPLRTVQDLVDMASQRGATTLVACGNDDTFNQMLAAALTEICCPTMLRSKVSNGAPRLTKH